jgi:hypothetical protein
MSPRAATTSSPSRMSPASHPELSDALCTIATGGGQAGRQFYTNGEEHIIEAHNPVVLNGIGAVITRADLLDRTPSLICLPVIK